MNIDLAELVNYMTRLDVFDKPNNDPLVMTNSLPWYRWPFEIDGLPNLKMVDLSMAMLNNQMVPSRKWT